jgi:hypothetical protein
LFSVFYIKNLNCFYSTNSKCNKISKNIEFKDLPKELVEVIIGLALGDLHIRRRYANTSLNFKGSVKHKEYIFHLYSLFAPFCNSPPKVVEAKLGSKTFGSVVFDTLTYSAFNTFHELFYVNGVKIVPVRIEYRFTSYC